MQASSAAKPFLGASIQLAAAKTEVQAVVAIVNKARGNCVLVLLTLTKQAVQQHEAKATLFVPC